MRIENGKWKVENGGVMSIVVIVAVIAAMLQGGAAKAESGNGSGNEVQLLGLLGSTNFWLVSQDDFHASAATNFAALGLVSSVEDKMMIEKWSEWVLASRLPSYDLNQRKSIMTWKKWAQERTWALRRCVELNQDVGSTNIWLAVADELAKSRSFDQGTSPKSISDNGEFSDKHRFEQARSNSLTRIVAGVHGMKAKELEQCVVQTIGKEYMPRLSAEMRWGFYSNFVERARLTDIERAEIRGAIRGEQTEREL